MSNLSHTQQPVRSNLLRLALQPVLWFVLMTSTLACASQVALGLIG